MAAYGRHRKEPARVILTHSGSQMPPPYFCPYPARPCLCRSHITRSLFLGWPVMFTRQVVSLVACPCPFPCGKGHPTRPSLSVLCTHHYWAHVTWLVNPTGVCLSFPSWCWEHLWHRTKPFFFGIWYLPQHLWLSRPLVSIWISETHRKHGGH